jgi:two-component system sensor histidine kinase KdpD
MAGRGTETLGGATGLYFPLPAENRAIGVLGIRLHTGDRTIVPEKRHLLEAFASLIALAVNRAKLVEEANRAFRLEESERLWMALFNSLSHDLRTPLSSVIGAVTSLNEGGDLYDPAARGELLQTVEEEARRMNRLIGNLFDMARLKSGMLQLKKEWCDIEDIIGVAVSRFSRSLGNRPVGIEIEPDLPLVPADLGLIEQVMINLLDNALKYSAAGGAITVGAKREQHDLQVSVADRGEGISEKESSLVFDQFYRGRGTRDISGTGLGLTIAKAVVEAHGGRIWAAPNPAGGTVILFTLPLGDDSPGEVPVGADARG